VRNLSGPMSLRVTSYRTVAINGWPLACYAYDRSCAVRAEAKVSLADLAGRPCPHRWTRSGLQHPGGPRREIQRRCHLIVTSTRTSTRKMVELRGFEPLTFCMPYKSFLFRNVARCGPTSSFNRCTLPAVAWYRRSFAPRFAPLLATPTARRLQGQLVERPSILESLPGRMTTTASLKATAADAAIPRSTHEQGRLSPRRSAFLIADVDQPGRQRDARSPDTPSPRPRFPAPSGRDAARVVPLVFAAKFPHPLVIALGEYRPPGLAHARDHGDRRPGKPAPGQLVAGAVL